MLDPQKLKKDFPLLRQNLVYLDSASTSQKPRQVIEALKNYYENLNANIHRGIYHLSEQATSAYEKTRSHTAKFINARFPEEIIFTRNATESINLIARTWGDENVKEGEEILVSTIEHHSNLVPWQQLAKRKKARLKVIPLKKDFTLDIRTFEKLLGLKTKLLAITGMSNVLGTIPPIKEMIGKAHKNGTPVLVDGAQSAAHATTDVQDLDCDFFVFSAHKMLGPTGVGILYAREEILEKMPPFLHGGDMVKSVSQFNAQWNDLPWKFEAGTPNIADVIAFDAALTYLENIGMKSVNRHEQKLLDITKQKFSKFREIKIYSSKNNCGGILSFTLDNIHPHDIAQIFDSENICIRSGHHCCQPLMETLGIPATARMSFYLYNTEEDIEKAAIAIEKTMKVFG